MGGSDALSIRADIDGLADASSASSRMALMSAALPVAEADVPMALPEWPSARATLPAAATRRRHMRHLQ